MKRLFIFFALILFSTSSLTGEELSIYVQTSRGSFNHQALELLLQEPIERHSVHFCGTLYNALKTATENRSLAFCAVKNTTLPGKFVAATLEALQTFKITKVLGLVEMKIEMALIRHKDAVFEPITHIASHPAALGQISKWKQLHSFPQEIPIPEGTPEAARQLSEGILATHTAVIGSKTLAHLYPNLMCVEDGIQDLEDNTTTFILIETASRDIPTTEEEIKSELEAHLNPKEKMSTDCDEAA